MLVVDGIGGVIIGTIVATGDHRLLHLLVVGNAIGMNGMGLEVEAAGLLPLGDIGMVEEMIMGPVGLMVDLKSLPSCLGLSASYRLLTASTVSDFLLRTAWCFTDELAGPVFKVDDLMKVFQQSVIPAPSHPAGPPGGARGAAPGGVRNRSPATSHTSGGYQRGGKTFIFGHHVSSR
jgi:hypothetical protein